LAIVTQFARIGGATSGTMMARKNFDHEDDEFEWVNLANKSEYNEVKAKLARWLQTVNAPDAPFKI